MLDALVFYRKAREMDPDNFDYAAGMADIYTELEFFEESNALIYEALRKNPKRAKECTFLMGCNFMGLSYLSNADRCFRKYLADYPNGEFTEEIENFFKFIKNENPNPDDIMLSTKDVYEYARISKARHLIANKKENISIEIYRDILADDPTNTIALNDLSLAYYAKGDMDKAISCAKEVLELDEENITALSNLIIFYKAVGDELAVAKLTTQLLDADIVTPDDFQKTAFILSWTGMYEDAYDCIMTLLSFNPHDVVALHAAAVSAYNLGSYEEAIEYWEDILKIMPENTIATHYIAHTHKTLDTDRHDKLEYIFDIPDKERKRRFRALERFITRPKEDQKVVWAEDSELRSIYFWALDHAPADLHFKLIEAIALFDDDQTKQLLYRQLLKPKLKSKLKKRIMRTLAEWGESEPFFADVDGRVDTYYLNSEMDESDISSGEFQDIFLLVIGYLTRLGLPRVTESFMIMYSIISENKGLKGINRRHKKHIAAAFIYLAAKHTGNPVPLKVLCRDFGISAELVRRYRKVLAGILML